MSNKVIERQFLTFYGQSPTRRYTCTKVDKSNHLTREETIYFTGILKWSNNLTFDNYFRKAFLSLFVGSFLIFLVKFLDLNFNILQVLKLVNYVVAKKQMYIFCKFYVLGKYNRKLSTIILLKTLKV